MLSRVTFNRLKVIVYRIICLSGIDELPSSEDPVYTCVNPIYENVVTGIWLSVILPPPLFCGQHFMLID